MTASMNRIQSLCRHPLFQKQAALLKEAEQDRIFCRHTMEHFLDVARIMYIYNLEDHSGLNKELIYATALLHDIGRFEQFTQGTPHHTAGARIAGEILPACSFSCEDTVRIQQAISGHRSADASTDDILSIYLYRADKQSRNCFACPAAKECNWTADRKNNHIQY